MKISIYIACHKQVQVLNDIIFHPVQVGTALNNQQFENYLHDNTGDNISEKNLSYCELTALYWAWKNEDADYYGFMHYRRYFSFDETKKVPYIEYDAMGKALQENNYISDQIETVITNTDMIMPIGEKMSETVYEQYKNSRNHHITDLDIVLQIIREKYPEYQQAAESYMDSKVQYFCNMFIMKKDIFHTYCTWLFDILAEHEKRVSLETYNQEEYRVSGFLAERLLGIFYTYLKMNTDLVCKELSRIHFEPNVVQASIVQPICEEMIVPVVFAVNDTFMPYLSVTIQSLLENCAEEYFYHLIVLHAGSIQEQNKGKLMQLAIGKDNCKFDFYDVSVFLADRNFFVDKHLSVETYFRLFIPDIVPFYDKVVYLDCDLVLQEDVSKLYTLNLDGYYLAAAKDLDYIGQFKIDQERRIYTANVLELQNGLEYFQAGVLVLNLAMFRSNYSVEQLIKIALSKKWRFHDQDVLNFICKNKVLFLPQQWNVVMNWKDNISERMAILKQAPLRLYQEYMSARKEPFIIHYAGYQKPWNSKTCDYDAVFWEYARKTAFYENILLGCGNTENTSRDKSIIPKLMKNKALLNKLFPPGTKRRIVAKKMKRFLKI